MEDKNKTVTVKEWIMHSEFAAIITTVITLFLFLHHEHVHLSDKFDLHAQEINKRCDEIHKRCDDLHKEFYDLLKQMNKKE